jgi:hypothetical protein
MLAWNSTCFGQFLCPSSGVYSPYTQQCNMSHRFVDSFSAGPGWNSVPSRSWSKAVYKPVWHITLLSVRWINSWWWTEDLSETRRVSCQNKLVKLMHLLGFIIKKFIMMHGHMNVKYCRYFRLEGIKMNITDPNLLLYLNTDGMKYYDIKICATSRSQKKKLT